MKKHEIEKYETPSTRAQEILYHLKYIGAISSINAIKEYGNTRLAASIHDLRKDGYDIRGEDKEFVTRFKRRGKYKEYYLVRYD